MKFGVWRYQRGLLPPALVPLVGLKVVQAWAIPPTSEQHGMLIVRFENRRVLKASATPAYQERALEIAVGTDMGNDWSFLDKVKQPPQTSALVGRRFTGMDVQVLTFGSVGARITLGGVEWVREAD